MSFSRNSWSGFGAVVLLVLSLHLGCKEEQRSSSGPPPPQGGPPSAVAPRAPDGGEAGLSNEIQGTILAMPLLAERYFDDKKEQVAFRVTGRPKVVSRTPRVDGELLHLALNVERRAYPGQHPIADTLLVDVLVDSAGGFVSAESRGMRDADTRELETLLAK